MSKARRRKDRRKRTAIRDAERRERRRRRKETPPGIRVVCEAEGVFRDAILAGVLSADRGARNWAGHYLYLFHDEDGTAWFKHRDTRVCVSMTARRRASGYMR